MTAEQCEHTGMAVATAEAALVARARSDPAAFAPLYARYFPRIYGYCLHRLGSATEAEDLTSTVFIHALAGLAGFRDGSFAAWLFQIAHHDVASHLRRQRSTRTLLTALRPTADSHPGVEEAVVGQMLEAEQNARLARVIADLSEEQQELLALKVSGRLSSKEIAAVLGKSDGAVRVALHRLMQRMRAAYQEREAEEGA